MSPGRALPPRHRSYWLMRQTKTLPPVPVPFAGGSSQVVANPYWEMVLPDVVSASLSLDAWTRIPLACESAHTRYFLPQHRPSPPRTRVGMPERSALRLPSGPVFRDGSHSFPFRPPSLLATQIAPTVADQSPQGSRGVYIRAERMSLPSYASDMLVVRTGQLTTGDFHPIRLTALSAAPPRLRGHPLRTCRGALGDSVSSPTSDPTPPRPYFSSRSSTERSSSPSRNTERSASGMT